MGDLRAAIANDYKIWANRESVALISVARTRTTQNSLTDCKRRAPSYREQIASGGAVRSDDLVWLVPTAVLPDGVDPKPADRIREANGTEWTVLAASLNTLRTWWRLETRNMVVVENLRELISLWRPENGQDFASGRKPTFRPVSLGIPARIQETLAETQDRLGKRQTVKRYQVAVGERIYPEALDQIRDSAGNVYQVLSSESPDRIDQLQIINVERV